MSDSSYESMMEKLDDARKEISCLVGELKSGHKATGD